MLIHLSALYGAGGHAGVIVLERELRAARRLHEHRARVRMRGREIHDAGDEAVGVVVHGLAAAGVEHVHPHLLQRPAEALAEQQRAEIRAAAA